MGACEVVGNAVVDIKRVGEILDVVAVGNMADLEIGRMVLEAVVFSGPSNELEGIET